MYVMKQNPEYETKFCLCKYDRLSLILDNNYNSKKTIRNKVFFSLVRRF